MNTSKVSRVEVIDHTPVTDDNVDYGVDRGRVYVRWEEGIKVEAMLQDDGRTLKIFITR